MLINKIITGYVVQVMDSETGKYVSQSFVEGDCIFEDQHGTPLTDEQVEQAETDAGFDLFDLSNDLPTDMVQPK